MSESPQMYAELVPMLQETGDAIAGVFDQMMAGNWQDDHGHDVKRNVEMVKLAAALETIMKFRTKHLGYGRVI